MKPMIKKEEKGNVCNCPVCGIVCRVEDWHMVSHGGFCPIIIEKCNHVKVVSLEEIFNDNKRKWLFESD